MSVKLLTEHHLEFQSLTGGCPGSSESIRVKMPHCWKSHVTAQFFIIIVFLSLFVLTYFVYSTPPQFLSCLPTVFQLKAYIFIQLVKLMILTRWLHQRPAYLDLQCFQKRISQGSAGQWLVLKYQPLSFDL